MTAWFSPPQLFDNKHINAFKKNQGYDSCIPDVHLTVYQVSEKCHFLREKRSEMSQI